MNPKTVSVSFRFFSSSFGNITDILLRRKLHLKSNLDLYSIGANNSIHGSSPSKQKLKERTEKKKKRNSIDMKFFSSYMLPFEMCFSTLFLCVS